MATPAQLAEKGRQDRPRSPSPSTLDRQPPPPLPPRTTSSPGPPAYSEDDARRSILISEQWRSHDPRSSSTHSLVPSESARDGRRKLLLIFIHGFMGNETSFQSFPAHLHNLLTITLGETHVVHTKIYPRYKSRKAIDFARDDFSTWLEPYENDHTDIILLGHSMGGLLAAEVALMKPASPATGRPFRHRILGTISFDTPFLGMHPGVVLSGVGSLFRPAPDPPGKTRQASVSTTDIRRPSLSTSQSASSHSYAPSVTESEHSSLIQSITSPLASPPPKDPFFNAPFPNDVRLPERKGWANLFHFINKHSDGLTTATMEYFTSHLEFGGCLADYSGLKSRYERLRALEDADDTQPRSSVGYQPPVRRIRFANYYTASTGRPKPVKVPPGYLVDSEGHLKPVEVEMQDFSHRRSSSRSNTPTPRISVEEVRDGGVTPKVLDADISPVDSQLHNLGIDSGVEGDEVLLQEMQHIDSIPIPDDEDDPAHSNTQEQSQSHSPPYPSTPFSQPSAVPESGTPLSSPPSDLNLDPTLNLPPLTPLPTPPPPLNPILYPTKDLLKLAEKDQKRLQKTYNQAVKDRESAIKDRQKLIEKREKQALKEKEKARKEEEKRLKDAEKQRLKEEKNLQKEKEKEKENESLTPTPSTSSTQPHTSVNPSVNPKDQKPKKDKKFCMLPSKINGQIDECWVRVYMQDVDEVGAHCGLFFPGGEQYEWLVGDVGRRVEGWVLGGRGAGGMEGGRGG